MKKAWLVFRYEYLRHVLRKRFVFGLLSIPFFVLLTIGIGFLAVLLQSDQRPAGYVDFSGVLIQARPVPAQSDSLIPGTAFQPFASAELANQALESGKIQGYFVLASDYLKNGRVHYTTQDTLKDNTRSDFREFIRYNLAAVLAPSIAARVIEGPQLVVRALAGSQSSGEFDFIKFILPFITGLIFVMVINISGSYLVQALVEEKENRTMEIMVTSVSPEQLMAGKVVGNLSVGITQLLIWIIVGGIGLWFARQNFAFAADLRIEPEFIIISILTLIPAFVLVAALMATAGATTTDSREAQQLAGLFTLPVMIPFWFITILMESPNSPVSIGLSLFPLTAPVALPIRASFTSVPFWQTSLAIGLLFISAIGAIWLSGRTFRLGMLRYGQRLTWAEIWKRGAAR